MIVKPCSVQHRCQQWGQYVQQNRVHFARSASVFGRIAEMQDNAGIHGDGIRYEIIDGVSFPPDGGMSAVIEQRGRELAHNIRCKETHDAIMMLELELRAAIEATYIVNPRDDVRSTREAGALLGVSNKTVSKRLKRAHQLISDRIYGVFELEVADEDNELDVDVDSSYLELIDKLERLTGVVTAA